MLAFKQEINEIESKEWPAYSDDIFDSSETESTYLARVKVNSKDTDKTLTLDQVIQPTQLDLNPMIYVRLCKPLKEGQVLDPIQLKNFYPQKKTWGLSVSATPYYGLEIS